MYKLVALLVFTLSVAVGVGGKGQEPEPELSERQLREMARRAAQAEIERQELINLENEAAHAIQLNNPTFFRRVYSDDFTGTLSHGQAVNKASFIEAIQNPETKYASFVASDINVHIFQETAIATCLWSYRATYKGKSISSQMRVLHVYLNGPRGWRVVAGQNTSLPPDVQQPL
jgi:ketosteroid isomerase-like protein